MPGFANFFQGGFFKPWALLFGTFLGMFLFFLGLLKQIQDKINKKVRCWRSTPQDSIRATCRI